MFNETASQSKVAVKYLRIVLRYIVNNSLNNNRLLRWSTNRDQTNRRYDVTVISEM